MKFPKRNQFGSFLRLFGMGVGVEGWASIDPDQPVTWIQPIIGIAALVYGLLMKGEEAEVKEVKAEVRAEVKEVKAEIKADVKDAVADAVTDAKISNK